MKGGKEGRKRRSAGGGAGKSKAPRGKPVKGAAPRPAGAAPKKGSPKRPQFGPRSTVEDE
jgi:hypothetical protein